MDQQTEAKVLLSLGELHSKVDLLLQSKTDHGSRIANIEKWMWTVTGAFGLFCTFFVYKTRTLLGL